jgi:lipopolysaccharide export system permease protein
MRILTRYLLRRFFATFFVALFCFVLIFDLVNLIEQIGRFLESDATTTDIFLYYVYFTPFIVVLTTPIATLLAAIFSVGLAARRNELTAMKAAGVSLYRLTLPLLTAGVLISAALWVFGEMVMPEANLRKAKIKAEKFERRRSYASSKTHRDQMFLGTEGRIFHFGNYRTDEAKGERVVIQTFSGNRLSSIVTAEELAWQDSVWVGYDVVFREFKDYRTDPEPIRSWRSDYYRFDEFDEKPGYFDTWFLPEDALSMGYFKLKRFIEVSDAIGRDTTKQLVDLYTKVAFPFINVIIILIGVALASNPRRSGLAISFGLSMCVSFVFYTIVKIAIELGHEGTIPPLVAAWGANVLFFLLGLWLLVRTPK